jgi:hypothetical protein
MSMRWQGGWLSETKVSVNMGPRPSILNAKTGAFRPVKSEPTVKSLVFKWPRASGGKGVPKVNPKSFRTSPFKSAMSTPCCSMMVRALFLLRLSGRVGPTSTFDESSALRFRGASLASPLHGWKAFFAPAVLDSRAPIFLSPKAPQVLPVLPRFSFVKLPISAPVSFFVLPVLAPVSFFVLPVLAPVSFFVLPVLAPASFFKLPVLAFLLSARAARSASIWAASSMSTSSYMMDGRVKAIGQEVALSARL